VKESTKIAIVAVFAWLMYSRSASAGESGGGGGGGGGSGSGSNGGGGLNLPTIGSSTPLPPGTGIPQSGTAPGLDGGEVPNYNYSCGTVGNPFVGTVTDPQDGRVIGVCAGDPRMNHPSFVPYEDATNPFEISLY